MKALRVAGVGSLFSILRVVRIRDLWRNVLFPAEITQAQYMGAISKGYLN
jgi:hypothetical protein